MTMKEHRFMMAAVTNKYLNPIREKRKPQISLKIGRFVPRQTVSQRSRNENPVKKYLLVVLGSQKVFVVHDDVVVATGDEKNKQSHHPEHPRSESCTLVRTVIASSVLNRHHPFLAITLLVLENHGDHHHEAG